MNIESLLDCVMGAPIDNGEGAPQKFEKKGARGDIVLISQETQSPPVVSQTVRQQNLFPASWTGCDVKGANPLDVIPQDLSEDPRWYG